MYIYNRLPITVILLLWCAVCSVAQSVTVAGKVVDEDSKLPVEFASVLMKENGYWAITDVEGRFVIKGIPMGKTSLTVQCLGYSTRSFVFNITKDITQLNIRLKPENLKLDEVTVVAKRKSDEATTSYVIDRTALDNQQILNLSDVSTLLPGGKTVNPSLMNDDRIALRSDDLEKGNASFGTAIEIDGIRVENNAMMGETLAASTRNASSSNIESVEIVTGIPSVEYGDLSNGVVKVNTRKGKSPFIVEGKQNLHTRQLAINKGLELGKRAGVLNASLEHARSFSDIASPYTAYQRNILSMNYMNVLMRDAHPLTLNVGMTGNMGGYSSKADPDETLESYTKEHDNLLRTYLNLNWLLNKSWITNLELKTSFSYQDKRTENYANAGSASAQPYIHTQEEGYYIAEDYDVNPNANIILGPTGYWYVRGYNDQKPINYSLKLKADWAHRFGGVLNKLMLGTEYKGNGNDGRGTYYEDMRYAPTWREYRYDQLPWMRNLAFYVEDKMTMGVAKWVSFQLTAGLREDVTMISDSDYGDVSSLSPRVNGRLLLWQGRRKSLLSDVALHAGWGKSVKLPSFQVLYPAPSYSDILVFTPGSTADNRAYYAYYTYPHQSNYNDALRWQYTYQTDIGIEAKVAGTRISLSAFWHKTRRPYMSVNQYTPFAYKVTGQSAIEKSGVASADRSYGIDRLSGVVTLTDLSGTHEPMELAYTERHTYNTNRYYINGSPISRWGLEWIVDFAPIKALRTSLRVDGNYYNYKGVDETLFAANATGVGEVSNPAYPLLGYYRGSSSTSVGTVSSATLSNGSESSQVNLNATLTTHVPKVRLIVALRLESSLYNYKRSLSQLSGESRGIVIDDVNDYFGEAYDGSGRNQYVAVYPEYYATWDNPGELIPFAERFDWARENDKGLYNKLANLVVKTNYAYTLDPNRLSKFFSANFTVTKEIGDHVSVSFYANNFFNNFGHVTSSQTGLKTSLFSSSYIPRYYYGLSLRLKI